jgi:hypothetical protein
MWRDAVENIQGQHHHDIVMKKAEQGNSRSYTVSRLRRESPDLYEEVKEGRLSANAFGRGNKSSSGCRSKAAQPPDYRGVRVGDERIMEIHASRIIGIGDGE